MNGPVVFFHGFEENVLFCFVDALKKAAAEKGLNHADIAFSTSTLKNREWQVKKLINEVRREHDLLHEKKDGSV
jgi:hypothetical protein